MANKTIIEHYELYGGKVQLDYWPASHKYVVDDDRKIGVTTITGVINKEALMTWPLQEAVSYLNNIFDDEEMAQLGWSVKSLKEAVQDASKAYLKKQLRGTDAGTEAHAWLEKYLRSILDPKAVVPEPLKKVELTAEEGTDEYIRQTDFNNIVDSVQLFLDWMGEHEVEVLDVERIIYSIEHDYCGRFDAVLKIDGKVYIIDFKTSNPSRDFQEGIYPENFAQSGGYDIAYTEEFPKQKIDGHAVFNLSKKKPSLNICFSEDRQVNRDFFLFALGTKRGMQFWTNKLKYQDKERRKK